MVEALGAFWRELSHILLESGVWLLAGLALAGVVHAFVPRRWMMRHLGGAGAWPVVKASLLGIPMPLCSCSVIPVAAGLRRQGVRKGPTAAFAISTPQTGEESVPLTWALFGPVFALARPVVAVVTGIVAGLVIESVEGRDNRPPGYETGENGKFGKDGQPAACCGGPLNQNEACSGGEHPVAAPSFSARAREAWSYGFGVMLRDLAPWLAVGIVMAAGIAAAVPPGWIASHAGTGIWPKLAMLVVGVPLYICATSSTPLAWSLVMAGLSPGAALVLLLAGPATSVATMSWVVKDLGVRSLVIYLAVIGAMALGAGVLFDAYFADMVVLAVRGASHGHPSGVWGMVRVAGAVVFTAALAWALLRRCWPGGQGACSGPLGVSSIGDVPPETGAGCCGAAGAGRPCGCGSRP